MVADLSPSQRDVLARLAAGLGPGQGRAHSTRKLADLGLIERDAAGRWRLTDEGRRIAGTPRACTSSTSSGGSSPGSSSRRSSRSRETAERVAEAAARVSSTAAAPERPRLSRAWLATYALIVGTILVDAEEVLSVVFALVLGASLILAVGLFAIRVLMR